MLGLVVALALGGGWWWWQHAAADAAGQRRAAPPAAVGVAAAQRQNVPLQISALGTVNSTYTVTVRSRVDGQLDKLHFEEGQPVKQGQLLAELDPRPFQAALAQAEGQLLRDQALLQNAQLDLNRYRQLLEQNSIAKQQVDTQAALVRQYQGTVKLDQGAVDNARLQLSYSRVTAPVSGRAGLRQVDPGNIVHASDANGLVVITQTQPINVLFSVPEVSLGRYCGPAAPSPASRWKPGTATTATSWPTARCWP
ncbi:efflux RND transporter periplasmic adaptor subunit [Chromobacterium sp. Beijing]|uniref:efflux RND transporter periplasmic adaptor subunit n=1 Tax=Chromobacterium sp. Beijing TaxID=2735795 RepID=UPI0021025817|nr:efflux RND transporter periplasmic adaptor subunit [Chromobacterium sp. Beijing]